ncbi:MAG: hypothetical protein WCJ09_16600 [Planctomycetota bacterium]
MVPLGIHSPGNYNPPRIGICQTSIVAGTTVVWSPVHLVHVSLHFQYIN